MEEIIIAYNTLVGIPAGNIPLVRPRRRWEDNIRTDLGENAWEGVEWMYLAQDRDQAVVNTVIDLRVP
jgi:hypothetical protein